MSNTFTLKAFKKTIAVLNTAEALTTAATDAAGRFATSPVLHTPAGNSATVYIGGSAVDATNGFPLIAGSTISLGDLMKLGTGKPFDLSAIYVYGAASDVVNVLHEVRA